MRVLICWLLGQCSPRGRVRFLDGDEISTGRIEYYTDCRICGREL